MPDKRVKSRKIKNESVIQPHIYVEEKGVNLKQGVKHVKIEEKENISNVSSEVTHAKNKVKKKPVTKKRGKTSVKKKKSGKGKGKKKYQKKKNFENVANKVLGEVQQKIADEQAQDLHAQDLTDHSEKPIETSLKGKDLTSSSFFSSSIIILTFMSIMLFLLAGYVYPATGEDIVKGKIFWAINNGEFDRGLFTQFYTSFVFTACVFLLGFYVNMTFVKYGLESWTIFSIGIYQMFLYGLGKIGELTFNHELFAAFKDLILPGALIILAYACYRIFKDLKGDNIK